LPWAKSPAQEQQKEQKILVMASLAAKPLRNEYS